MKNFHLENSEDQTDRHFQGQQKAERVNFSCRRHPIILLRIVTVWLILSLALFLGMSLTISQESFGASAWVQGLFLVQAVVFIGLQHVFFLKLINYHLALIVVTNYRLIDMQKSLFMQDDKEIIDLHEIQDTKKVQSGIWSNLLNYGDVLLTVSSSSLGPTVLHDLPNPEYYLNQINAAKRHYIVDRRKQKGAFSPVGGESHWELPARSPRSLTPRLGIAEETNSS